MKVNGSRLSTGARAALSLGYHGFGRSESRAALRDFFEVDAKHIVLRPWWRWRAKKIPDVVSAQYANWEFNPERRIRRSAKKRSVALHTSHILRSISTS